MYNPSTGLYTCIRGYKGNLVNLLNYYNLELVHYSLHDALKNTVERFPLSYLPMPKHLYLLSNAVLHPIDVIEDYDDAEPWDGLLESGIKSMNGIKSQLCVRLIGAKVVDYAENGYDFDINGVKIAFIRGSRSQWIKREQLHGFKSANFNILLIYEHELVEVKDWENVYEFRLIYILRGGLI